MISTFTHWPVDHYVDHTVCYTVVMRGLQLAGLTTEIFFFEEAHQTIAISGGRAENVF